MFQTGPYIAQPARTKTYLGSSEASSSRLKVWFDRFCSGKTEKQSFSVYDLGHFRSRTRSDQWILVVVVVVVVVVLCRRDGSNVFNNNDVDDNGNNDNDNNVDVDDGNKANNANKASNGNNDDDGV